MAAGFIVAATLLLAASVEGQDSPAAALQKPTILAIEPVQGPGPDQDAEFVMIRFTQVSGAQGYRVYRELELEHEPELKQAWVPWGYVDAVPGNDTVSLVMIRIRGESGRFGVAAEFDQGGQVSVSEIATLEATSTAVVAVGWGAVKGQR